MGAVLIRRADCDTDSSGGQRARSWCNLEFAAARGLLSGTGNSLFFSNETMTRGMFVTALGKLAGINPDSCQTRRFTTLLCAYVELESKKNIVIGIKIIYN